MRRPGRARPTVPLARLRVFRFCVETPTELATVLLVSLPVRLGAGQWACEEASP